jgi:hypothetical protein
MQTKQLGVGGGGAWQISEEKNTNSSSEKHNLGNLNIGYSRRHAQVWQNNSLNMT